MHSAHSRSFQHLSKLIHMFQSSVCMCVCENGDSVSFRMQVLTLLVVEAALLGVCEDLICLGNLLELLLCIRVRVFVRMIAQCQALVRASDLLLVGVARHS